MIFLNEIGIENIYLITTIGLSLFYVGIISIYVYGWDDILKWEIPKKLNPKTKVTVLIPARNEAENISKCLNSIIHQDYPKELFEIVVLDDFSTDETVEIVTEISKELRNVRCLKLADFFTEKETQSFKKKAIEVGIQNSKGDLIVTTDADCIVPEKWLKYLVSFYEKRQVKFIAAPVNFYQEPSLFERFQSLDFLGMMCVTGAGIQLRLGNMCNGANLAYEKSAFYEVDGFEGINQIASGDDMLLMQKIAERHPDKIGFLKNKNATVYTRAKPNLKSFLSQRIRWASKSTHYKEWRVTFILGMVFLFCLNILLSLILISVLGLFALKIFVGQLVVKLITDYFFLGKMARFFDRKDLMRSYFFSQILHILYIVVVGILGNLIKKYEWKGRQVN